MLEKTRKLITWICLAVAVLGSVCAIIFAMTESSALYGVAYGILLAALVLAVLFILGFAATALVKSGKQGIMNALKVLGIVVAVLLVAFLLSKGDDVNPILLEKTGLSNGASKLIGAGAITVYILVFGAFLSIVYVEVSKAFKK